MMKRVLKLGNNQLNNILCEMLRPPSLLFLVLTRMIASSEKILTSSPGSSRFPIWRQEAPYWKARRPWGRGWQQFNHVVCNGSKKGIEKILIFAAHFCIVSTKRRQVLQNFKILFCARLVPSRHFYLFSQRNMKRQFDAHKGA